MSSGTDREGPRVGGAPDPRVRQYRLTLEHGVAFVSIPEELAEGEAADLEALLGLVIAQARRRGLGGGA